MRPSRGALAAVLAAGVLLGGCSASPTSDRSQLSAPGPVSAAYSEMNLQLRLIGPDAPDGETDAPDLFERRVALLGERLAKAAFEHYPGLRDRLERFEFLIVDKAEPGTVSNASGRIVLLRPVSALATADAALAFIAAREMGHVIANHHGENVAAGLAVSGIAYLLFPVAGIAKAFTSLFAPAAAAGAGTSLAANAGTTAASLVGSRVVVLSYRPRQQQEADAVALALAGKLGYDTPAVVKAFDNVDLATDANQWTADLRGSITRLTHP